MVEVGRHSSAGGGGREEEIDKDFGVIIFFLVGKKGRPEKFGWAMEYVHCTSICFL